MKKLILLFLLLPIGVLAQNQARMISGTNNITSCPYTIAKQDVTKLDVFITSTACAVTLPAATVQGFGKGSIFSVKNNGTGSVTITPTGEQIDGNASVTLLPGAGMDIYSTGTGYSSQPGSGSGGGGGGGINPPAGDIGGNAVVPLVISTHLNSPLPILQGGTGTQTPALVAGTGVTITGTWPNNTISSTSACWENNGTPLTCEPFANAVPPLTATLNVGNNSIDVACPTAVGVGGSHASGCVPDPGASGTTTDYLGRDMNYHTATSAATILPDPATGVQYVAGTCNGGSACVDGNNGLSWGAAKLTITGACQALPNGATGTCGAGTIFVGNGAVANAVSGKGFMIMGAGDPNFSSPPSGWMKCPGTPTFCTMSIIGVPNQNLGANADRPTVNVVSHVNGGVDPNNPGLWISGQWGPIYIENLGLTGGGRGIVIGECSNNERTGTHCNTAGITLSNVQSGLGAGGSPGPCLDMPGYELWVVLNDLNCSTANGSPAIFIDGSTSVGSGQISIINAHMAGNGIKFIPGSSGGNITVTNASEESGGAPVLWFTSRPGAPPVSGNASGLVIADSVGGVPAFQNDDPRGLSTFSVASANGVAGSGVMLSQANGSTGTVTPLLAGEQGFFGGYMVGQSDIARTIAGLVPARFVNKANPDPATWVTNNGLGSVTTGLADPYGGTGAARVQSSGGVLSNYQLGACVSYTPANGDWVIGGGWAQGVTTGSQTIYAGCNGIPAPTIGTAYGGNGMNPSANGDWSFHWFANKMVSAGATQIALQAQYNNTQTPTIYGPLLFIIPAGTITDNEAIKFATTMNSLAFNCPAGSSCNVPNHPVNADQFAVRSGNFASTVSSASLAANRAITMPDPLASAALPLLTGSITGTKCLHTVGTAGVIQETAADCGSGGGSGTIDPSLQFSMAYYNTAGSVSHVGGVAGPTGPNSVPSFWVTIPSGSAATAPQPILAGIPGRTVAGASDTILATDRVSTVTYTNAGATAVSLPGAGTTGFGSNFCFKMIVQGASDVVTITPVSGTINGGATQTVLQGQKALVCSFDNSNYIATIADPPAAAGTNIALTRGDSSLSFASSAGGGTVTHTGSLTAGSLVKATAAADITNADLTGDCTTSGTVATTCTALNGGTFAGTTGNLVSFGASNIPADSGIVASNVITSTGTMLSGNVVTGASPKTISITSILANNLVTATSNASFTDQLCAAGASKACVWKSWADVSYTDYTGVTTGAVNVLAGCPTQTATALTAGMTIAFLPNLANTNISPSTATLNLCTLGAKNITKLGTAILAANDLITTAIAVAIYDGTGWELQNPQTSSGGGSTALSSITAAAATNTIANVDFTQFWNWAQVTNGSAGSVHAGLTIGETSAATNGTITTNISNQAALQITTASASTATPLSVQQGSITGTTAYPALQITSTFNNSGLTGQGIVESITNTSSNGGSKLINLLAGSGGTTSMFSIDVTGNALFAGSISSTGAHATSATSFTTYQGGIDGVSTAPGGGTFRGGDTSTTTAASTAGSTTVRGGNATGSTANALNGGAVAITGGGANSSTSTSATGGNVTVTAGSCTAVASATACPGIVKINQVAFTASATANDLACVGATANEVDTCSGQTGTGQFVGVIDSVTSNNVFFTTLGVGGRHTFNATSATFTLGHFVCQSTVAASGHLVVDGGTTACAAGFGVGIYVGATGTTTTPLVMMRPY